jgi:hypothetical protein
MCNKMGQEMAAQHEKVVGRVRSALEYFQRSGTVGAGELDLENDPNLKRIDEGTGYIPILESNLKAGRVAYIDPTSQSSLHCLREKLQELPPIRVDQLQFNGTNPSRMGFNLSFEPYLGPLIVILQSHLDSIRIPRIILEHCLECLNTRIAKKCRYLNIVNSPDSLEKVAAIEEIELEYSTNTDEIDSEEQRLSARTNELEARMAELEQSITVHERAETRINEQRWDMPEGFGFTNRFVYDYTGEVRIIEVEKVLEEGTTETIRKMSDTEFCAVYTSSDAYKSLCEFGSKLHKPPNLCCWWSSGNSPRCPHLKGQKRRKDRASGEDWSSDDCGCSSRDSACSWRFHRRSRRRNWELSLLRTAMCWVCQDRCSMERYPEQCGSIGSSTTRTGTHSAINRKHTKRIERTL